jgi:hypothetical protein
MKKSVVIVIFLISLTTKVFAQIFYRFATSSENNTALVNIKVCQYKNGSVDFDFSKGYADFYIICLFTNLTDRVVRIIWEQSSLITDEGSSPFYFGAEYWAQPEKLKGPSHPIPPTILAPHQDIFKILTAETKIEYLQGAWKWFVNPLIVKNIEDLSFLFCIQSGGLEDYYDVYPYWVGHPKPDWKVAKNSEKAFPQGLSIFNNNKDTNNDGYISKDELLGYGRTVFNLEKESLVLAFYLPDSSGDLILQTWSDSGTLIGETKTQLNMNLITFYNTGPGAVVPNGDFLDKLKAAGAGKYRIDVILDGKTYSQDIEIINGN